jgi:hypothetical protein
LFLSLICFSFSRFGPRFLATVDTYDADLRASCKEVFEQLGLTKLMREGTYVMIGGPTFETVAESRLLKAFGGDAVGESLGCSPNVYCEELNLTGYSNKSPSSCMINLPKFGPIKDPSQLKNKQTF